MAFHSWNYCYFVRLVFNQKKMRVIPMKAKLNLLARKDNDREQWVNYNRASGARLSAMEHLVPEHKTARAVLHSEAAQWVNHMDVVNEMFSTDENPAHGISAVKAIQLAAAEGQKIWTITQANLDIALANIQLSNDIKTDIRNAVNAGQEVTTHEKFVNFYGKTSAGYIILNPTTGAGAYMITSGENGGELVGFALTLGLFIYFGILAAAALIAAPGLLTMAAALWVGVSFKVWIDGINKAQNSRQFNTNNAMAALALSLGFIPRVTYEIAAMILFVDAWIFMLGFI